MTDIADVLKTIRAMQKIAKLYTRQDLATENYKAYLRGYSDALEFVISVIDQKIKEAEEKENA